MVNEKNILSLIAEIQAELKAPKNQWNTHGKFNYRSAEDILEAVKPILFKRDMVQIITDEIVNLGNRYYIKATVTVYYGDQKLSVSAYAREPESRKGMDESQITGAASSYARKYALNGLYNIDDTKDADTDEFRRQTNKKSDPADDDRLPWDEPAESEYLTKAEVADLMNGAIGVLGKEEAGTCLKKMYEHYRVTSETLRRDDLSSYRRYIEIWADDNVYAGDYRS